MLFNSINFAVFFIVVTFLYYKLQHKYRWLLLLISSCFFYMCFIPVYILILAFTITVDYFAGIFVENSKNRIRQLFLIASLVANIGVLAFFKYFNFINDNIASLLILTGLKNPIPALNIILPIGLSFHTFQAMSYTIEVYRGRQKAEKHYGIYALYVMFYPQLVAGPIERPYNLIHQFYEKHSFNYRQVTNGLKLMAWGFFKKIVIADRLALLVNQVYNNHSGYEGFPLILATILFSFQIYCDFSGYSDIAIGAAQVMGFRLTKNFNRPYSSKSVSEFWRRWHISLSSWFRDYLYISMGGNRVSIPRWYLNLFIVFLISGLWHGAKWTFVIWGALHGIYVVLGIIINNLNKPFKRLINVNYWRNFLNILETLTTFALVSLAWVFFRAKDIITAKYIISHLFSNLHRQIIDIIENTGIARFKYLYLNCNRQILIIAILSIMFMEFIEYFQSKYNLVRLLSARPSWVRWSIYYCFISIILIFGIFNKSPQFIYFQF